MNTRHQLICAHSFIPFSLALLVGVFILPGFLPPPSPATGAEEVASYFRDNTQLRIGIAIAALLAPLFLGLPAALSAQMRRIEGKSHVLSQMQFGTAILQTMALQIPAFCWLIISYRSDIDPKTAVVFNDLAWFMIVGAAGQAIVQFASIGLCILGDTRPKPIYPRWLGFWNLWMIFGALPGTAVFFVKTGPFAWNGLFGFWTVLVSFFLWALANYIFTVEAIHNQRLEEDAAT